MAEYGVFLEAPSGEKVYQTFQAEGRHLAANAAEQMFPRHRPIAVVRRWDVAGRCSVCGGVVFEDERPQKTRRGVKCFECP